MQHAESEPSSAELLTPDALSDTDLADSFRTQSFHLMQAHPIAAAHLVLAAASIAPTCAAEQDVADEFSRNLSYGAQRRLEIARALATDPFLLLLDEPAAGMNPQETHELDELIVRIRDEEKVSILLIEHDMKLVMSISDRIYVVEYGKEIAQGTPREIKENKKVIEAYLGEEAHA